MTHPSGWHKPKPERLPKPSYAPASMALGLTLVLWGVVTSWIVSAIGLALTGVAAALWIGDFGVGQAAAPAQARSKKPRAVSKRRASHAVSTHWLHRTALLLAAATLALVLLGAGVTSQAGRAWEVSHVAVGAAVGALTIILAVLFRNRLGWILVGAVLLLAVLGNRTPNLAAFHAFLAQMFFAGTVAVALVTSKTWKREPEVVEDSGKSTLRVFAFVTVALVLAQVALGAAVRHKAIGAGLHISGAMIVALAIVILGVMVTNKCPTHRTLRPAAVTMMAVGGTQVFLGFGAFIVRMMVNENTLPVQIATMAHVTTGALTLASTVVLALELHRSLHPAATGSAGAVQQ
jgi:hypothetical protein